MSECVTNRVSVMSIGKDHAELAESNGSCKDYLQFDFGYSQSDKLCGARLNSYNERGIGASSFLAFFWSDNESPNQGTFRFRASCVNEIAPDSLDIGSADSPIAA